MRAACCVLRTAVFVGNGVHRERERCTVITTSEVRVLCDAGRQAAGAAHTYSVRNHGGYSESSTVSDGIGNARFTIFSAHVSSIKKFRT